MDAIPLFTRPARLFRDKADFFKAFRKTSSANDTIQPLYDPDQAREHHYHDEDVADLNVALRTLVDVFPDVEPEVFREMLSNVAEESRVAVVTEQILKRNLKDGRVTARRTLSTREMELKGECVLATEDTFRGNTYHEAVKCLLYQEFRSLNHSTIKGVMAETNASYIRSRPILHLLASRTWRSSLASLWRRRDAPEDISSHPALQWQIDSSGNDRWPSVKSTGSSQLDQELYEMFVRPARERLKHQQISNDWDLAIEINEADAIDMKAVYDCECCYTTVSFEQIATCDTGDHFLCFDCIRRTTSEALYGQGWARSADLEKMTIRCFAPAIQECQSSLSAQLVQRALQHGHDKGEMWSDLCKRITSENLIKSRTVLQRCPFCTYAEVDETPPATLRGVAQLKAYFEKRLQRFVSVRNAAVLAFTLTPFTILFSYTLLLCFMVMSYITGLNLIFASSISAARIGPFIYIGPLATILRSGLNRAYKRQQGLKFTCCQPACLRVSCTRCLAGWRDPHVCFDSEKTSLRTAIEASATAAVKRTCPRCLLSFVKASGCNKLVCNCSYTMCYICRSEITSKEGYSHFCQHFRPSGGRCSECDRCDLYGDEDEEAAIRRAAETAEREWREVEASKVQQQADDEAMAAKVMVEVVLQQDKQSPLLERCIDAAIDVLVTFESY